LQYGGFERVASILRTRCQVRGYARENEWQVELAKPLTLIGALAFMIANVEKTDTARYGNNPDR
jgi:hypothetical protein